MRVVDRDEFLLMPKYTVFAKSDLSFGPAQGDICVKMGNFGKKDFYYTDLSSFRMNENERNLIPCIEKMHENPDVEVPGKLVVDRDGLYEENMRFIIYDRHEIQQIVKLLTKVLGKMNDKQ